MIKSIAVFCGSKSGLNLLFEEHAKQLGYLLAQQNITLIYGGGNKGLMGAVANAVLEKMGHVIGIIPQLLTDREHSHKGISELIIVDNMHIRKQLLYDKCDAAIILPGGFGTLDEFYEMLTWNQLSIHNKQIFILNGKSKKVSKKDDLGIGSWGKIDFLINHQGYRKSMVSEF